MIIKTIRCNDCDCLLWSDEAKKLKLCPECQGEEEDEILDLEDQLDILLK
jgi:phage FluMu protein Com